MVKIMTNDLKTLFVELSSYEADPSVRAIQLYTEEMIPYATATVYVEDYDYKDGEVTIKNYSENKGILNLLLINGIVEAPHDFVRTGYVEVPVCKLNKEAFKDG